MDTSQKSCTLSDVRSFSRVLASDLLPRSIGGGGGTVIINAETHTERGSHWLAVHFRPKSSSAYYFDIYWIVPLFHDIQALIRCNSSVWDYNRRQLQGLTNKVCGKYCFLFALYTDRGYTRNNLSRSSMH